MSPSHLRSLRIFAEDQEIGAGCRISLEGEERLALRPGFYLLRVLDLSATAAARLIPSARVEVRSEDSVLASGTVTASRTHPEAGHSVTEATLIPARALWTAAVSASFPAGMSLRETARRLLEASGVGLPLAGFTGTDRILSRPQAYFGRLTDALSELAKAADAEVCVTPGGILFAGRADRAAALILTEADLLAAPEFTGDAWILRTSMIGWPPGARLRVRWRDTELEGRILTRSVWADNGSGPWKTELLLRKEDA